jgi:DnaA family protein
VAHGASGRVNESRSTQLPLDFAPAPTARFATFVGGPNRAPAEHAAALAAAGGGVLWLYGADGTGKSHLLQAACAAAAERGRRAMYVPLAAVDAIGPAALADLEALDVLALDDVDRVAGDAAWERRLFEVFNENAARGAALMLAARAAPRALGLSLPDLASRAAGAVVYRLQPLADEERARALIAHARVRGIELEAAAADYLLARVARDMNALTSWLERFDRESLAARKRLTIPVIRDLLNERD